MIQDFQHSTDKLHINVHSVLIESIVKVLSKFFILRLSVSGVLKVVFQERSFENIFWFD